MNKLSTEKRTVILASLVEGNSIRSTVRIHQTLRVSPAMAADVTDHLWEISEIISLLENKKAN